MEKFRFDAEFQNRLLGLIIYSDSFLKTIRQFVYPEHFESDDVWVLCTLAFEFYDKYGKAPKENLYYVLNQYAQRTNMDSDRLELLLTLMQGLYADQGLEAYYLEELGNFIRHQEARTFFEKFLPKFSSGDYDINFGLDEFQRISKIQFSSQNQAYDYLALVEQRIARRRDQIESQYIPTLIDCFDEKFRGIRAPELGTVMAPSGIGKSFMLVHLAKASMLLRHTVFFFTLEMPEQDIADRMDQMWIGVEKEKFSLRTSIDLLRKKFEWVRKRAKGVYLRYLPIGTSISQLQREIECMASDLKVSPDLIVIDYGDLLSPDGEGTKNDLYLEQRDIWRGLKSIAVTFDVPIWTATQSSRKGVGVKQLSELEVADSYEKVRNSDIFIGFNRNLIHNKKSNKWEAIVNEDVDNKLVRLFMIKHRGHADKYQISFMSNLARGIFYSKKLTDTYYEDRKDELEDLMTVVTGDEASPVKKKTRRYRGQ